MQSKSFPGIGSKNHVSGITLVELAVVLAVAGLLLALVVPAYRDFMARARMSEAFAVVGPLKSAVLETVMTQGDPATFLASLPIQGKSPMEVFGYTPVGYLPGSQGTRHVKQAVISETGVIIVQAEDTGCAAYIGGGEDITLLWLYPKLNASQSGLDWLCVSAYYYWQTKERAYKCMPAACQHDDNDLRKWLRE